MSHRATCEHPGSSLYLRIFCSTGDEEERENMRRRTIIAKEVQVVKREVMVDGSLGMTKGL
jgi:hypothetical protein